MSLSFFILPRALALLVLISDIDAWSQTKPFLSFGFHFDKGHKSTLNNSRTATRLFVEKETLIFSVHLDKLSDKIPSNDANEVNSFCRSKECRNHFLSAGGKSAICEEERNEALEELWKQSSEKWYGDTSMPDFENGDCVISTVTTVQFPGMKLLNTVYNGVKLLEDSNGNPYYKCLMVADKKKPVGAPPVVWIYNKLVGTDSKAEYSPASGKAQSSVSIVEIDGGHAIRFVCDVEIIVSFPKILMKILPSSKESIEEQGSASVRKAVEKDVINCLELTVEAFEKWNSSKIIQPLRI
jgi:hypothetical protein